MGSLKVSPQKGLFMPADLATNSAIHPILQVKPLGFPWATLDPFLFCVYHDDAYPRGNAQMGPDASLAGRNIGQDFARKDGWNMYHGTVLPWYMFQPSLRAKSWPMLRPASEASGPICALPRG